MMVAQFDLFGGDPHAVEPVKAKRNGRGRAAKKNSDTASQPAGDLAARLEVLEGEVAELKQLLVELRDLVVEQRTVKESYTTKEVAAILGKRPYTVREWCRLERVNAYKAMCGRGCEEEWRISHEELERIQNEGLLPEKYKF